MLKLLFPLLCLLVVALPLQAEQAPSYAVARMPAPVLNTSDFKGVFGGSDGRTLKTDKCGQVRELEFIALPGTPFRLLERVDSTASTIYRVETEDYPTPPGGALYVDSRFIQIRKDAPASRTRQLPTKPEILKRLQGGLGSPYVWGGNVQRGVPEMASFFYRGSLSDQQRRRLTLAGLDCSGLLYQATNGYTPRNTSELIAYGNGLPIAGRSAVELAQMLEPLDLIVWNGHVLIVLDKETVIESRLECNKRGHGGVVATPLKERLTQIMRTRQPRDEWPAGSKQKDIFVVRRWFVE